MKIANYKVQGVWFLILLISSFYIVNGFGQTRKAYEGYYRWTTSYPKMWDQDWWPSDRECQGVTHDNDNWYFTWTYKDEEGWLWKTPVWVDLKNNAQLLANTTIINMTQFQYLNNNLYWHWGAPAHYKNSGNDYIVIPMTAPNGPPPIVGIFCNMNLIGYVNLLYQKSVGWCAINPKSGDLYTSDDFDYTPPTGYDCDYQDWHNPNPRMLMHYSIPWTKFHHQVLSEKLMRVLKILLN